MAPWFLRLCAFVAIIASGLAGHGADGVECFGGKHALVIGIDGCRSDALQAARAPNIKSLIENGTVCYRVYAGGTLGTKTQQKTVSGPGWASILTGVWADKHRIPDNEFANPNLKQRVDGQNVGFPHFFTRIKQSCPNWGGENLQILGRN